jgi:riboflavin kinase/FMN adenylyltransferase
MDWEGNLYGSEMRVQLISFLRPEHKFHSLEELKQQIAKDCSSAKRMRSLI